MSSLYFRQVFILCHKDDREITYKCYCCKLKQMENCSRADKVFVRGTFLVRQCQTRPYKTAFTTHATSNLSRCFNVILLHILKLSAIITIYGIQARAWAQARPWALASLQFGPGSRFWKPKPTKARLKPGLWAQARPDTSLLMAGGHEYAEQNYLT